jgi:hypothetical protein
MSYSSVELLPSLGRRSERRNRDGMELVFALDLRPGQESTARARERGGRNNRRARTNITPL